MLPPSVWVLREADVKASLEYKFYWGEGLVNSKGKRDRRRQGELSECDAGVNTCAGRQRRKDQVGRVSTIVRLRKSQPAEVESPSKSSVSGQSFMGKNHTSGNPLKKSKAICSCKDLYVNTFSGTH